MNKLLTELRDEGLDVPKDARSFLGTPRNTAILEKAGGKYVYLGLKDQLVQSLEKLPHQDQIELQINVDGCPAPFAHRKSFWPILVRGFKQQFSPVMCCLWFGTSKPKPTDDFLRDFLDEIKALIDEGIQVNGQAVTLSIQAFICDTPARADLKGTKGHSGYYACERCTLKGDRSNGCASFVTINPVNKRTDDDFDQHRYSGLDASGQRKHQTSLSPLIGVVPCVSGFVLDSMHLVYLGVMKRLLSAWCDGIGPFIACKLSRAQQNLVSQRLLHYRGALPSEFSRQPQCLPHTDGWKATEYRAFLLYTGPIVMKDVLSKPHYKHFIALAVAISILCDENEESRNQFLDYASSLIKFFVKESPKLYSDGFVTYNIHSLLHVPEDVEHFDASLDSISAFPFESYLRFLKSLVRGSKNPIKQVVNRLAERKSFNIDRELTLSKCKISSQPPDNGFFITEREVLIISELSAENVNGNIVNVDKFEDCFKCGINSCQFAIGYVTHQTIRTSRHVSIRTLNYISKAVMFQDEGGFHVFPVHHEPSEKKD